MSFFTLFTIVFILYHLTMHAQKWEQLPGPFEEYIVNLEMNDKYLFVNEKTTGYNKSIDTGKTWIKMNLNSEYNLTVIGKYLYAFRQKDFIRSSDNGETWTKLKIDTVSIFQILTMNGSIYAHTNNGIWKSTDNGNRWKKTGGAVKGVSLCAGENSLFTRGSGYSAGGVFKSSDEGKTWSEDIIGLSNKNMSALAAKRKVVVVARDKGITSIYYSTSDGIGWDPSDAQFYYVVNIAINDYYVFINGSSRLSINELMRSKIQWESLKSYPHYVSMSTIQCVNNKLIFALPDRRYNNNTFRGLAYSNDNGDSWNRIGLPLGNIKDLYFDDSALIVGNTKPKEGLLAISTDYGKTWNEHDSLLTPYISHNNHRLACGKGIYVQSKDSDIWIKKDSRSLKYALSIGKNIIGVIDQEKGFLISSDNGSTWDTTYTELGTVTTLYKSKNTVYAGVKSKDFNKKYSIAVSKSNGTSWKKIFPTIDSRELDSDIKSICVNNELIFLGLENGSLVWSSDQGITWEKQESFGYSNAVATMINKDSTFFIATNKVIYRVEDNGKTLIPIQFNSLPINELAVVNDTLFVATERNGIWKYAIPPYIPSGVQNYSTLNKQLMCKVFPNPATDECVIQLHPFVENTKVFLYNTHGEKVTEFQLLSETTKFSTENLSAGVYTLIVQSDTGQQHHSFIVTR